MLSDIITIILSFVASAFFSGMEIAYVSSSKLQIELEKNQRKFPSQVISLFTRNSGRYIATMLVGNNVALVIYGFTMTKMLTPFLDTYIQSTITVLTIQTIVSTLIILITAEFLPKAIFSSNANLFLNYFALPVLFFYILFYPITSVTIWISRIFFGKEIKQEQEKALFSQVDLYELVNRAEKVSTENEEHDLKIFQNAMDFSKVKLRDFFVPRTEIVALNVEDSIDNLRQKFVETGLSKILIYENSIDNIIGYVHSSVMFKKPESIRQCLVPLLIVPETMAASKLLGMFIQQHKSIALVVDEFGGTGGMVTIEDVMEEIFGEIDDEHDKPEWTETKVSENEFEFSGRLEIDYLNETYDLKLTKADDYTTLAGYILFHHNNIPEQNQIINIPPYTFKILTVSETKIEKVHVIIANDE